MKFDVSTPDFCPDNCPNFEFTQNDVCRIAKNEVKNNENK